MHVRQLFTIGTYKKTIRVTYAILLLVLMSGTFVATSIIYTKQIAFDAAIPSKATPTSSLPPFPIGVHPIDKIITENSEVETYIKNELSYNVYNSNVKNKKSWIRYAIAKLSQLDWYQNLASPTGRILIVRPGARKEELLNNFSKILHWDEQMKQTFAALVVSSAPAMVDGKFFPAHYLVGKDATPEEVADIIIQRFHSEITTRYNSDVSRLVPLKDSLIIASLLEREAYDFTDMREISGIIWNRLFIGMNLQIDATLQYAKGTESATTWYPQVHPTDKYIDSPFNTYQNTGLPPSPIGNPSVAAVIAALNPINTDCLFYFHDKESKFHCTPTYEKHVALLKKYYGRGK